MANDESTYDVIVVGSGAGLVGAYAAAARGLRTLVIEKTDRVGGTTAYSGAGLWLPGAAPIARNGYPDDVEEARSYLRAVINDSSREARQDAYLAAAPQVIAELEQNPTFGEFTFQPIPDYFGHAPGATPTGRTIFPPEIPEDELGPDIASVVRLPIYAERQGADPGPVLIGGRALIGRALKAFLDTGFGELRLNTGLLELTVNEDGVVDGVIAEAPTGSVTLSARHGVILAAGGFEHNADLRAEHQLPELTGSWSNGAPGNTGSALSAGVAVGAASDLMDESWYVPGVVQPDGRPVFHTGTRGGIWVNSDGDRFVNEIAPYDQAGHAIFEGHRSGVSHIPVYWIQDQHQLDRDGYGGAPEAGVASEWFDSGAIRKADTVAELAALINIPADRLEATITRFNGFAATGVDDDFHRGETAWDRFFHYVVGYPTGPQMNYLHPLGGEEHPNPLLQPIRAPFYVLTIQLSDIGTKGGLVTDTHARVLRPDGTAIEGLYASGNTAAAWTGRVYPGAGGPVGTSLVYSYLAALDIAEKASSIAEIDGTTVSATH